MQRNKPYFSRVLGVVVSVVVSFGLATTAFAFNIISTSFVGAAANDQFGYSADSAGDLNGDGLADVVVSAPYSDSGSGIVYIYYGSTTRRSSVTTTLADATITNDGSSTYLGLSVAGVGDVNADGYDDIMLSSSGPMSGSYNAYLFYGPVSGTLSAADADTTITNSGVYPASYVAAAGDVNADGYDDVLVGSIWYGSTPWGRAHLFYGPLSGTLSFSDADASVYGDGYSGYSYDYEAYDYEQVGKVMTGADINGDGYSDLLLGMPGTNDAAVYYGPLAGTYTESIADVYIENVGADSVAVMGDVNNDGVTDIAIGDISENGNTGAVHIFFGPLASSEDDATADQLITGVTANDRFGTSLSAMGDTNGDGKAELLVGAPGANSYTGYAYVMTGLSASGTRSADTRSQRFSGSASGDYFGEVVSTVGDTDGDGRTDLLVAASDATNRFGVATGAVRLLYGR